MSLQKSAFPMMAEPLDVNLPEQQREELTDVRSGPSQKAVHARASGSGLEGCRAARRKRPVGTPSCSARSSLRCSSESGRQGGLAIGYYDARRCSTGSDRSFARSLAGCCTLNNLAVVHHRGGVVETYCRPCIARRHVHSPSRAKRRAQLPPSRVSNDRRSCTPTVRLP